MMLPNVQAIIEGANIHSIGGRIYQTIPPQDQTKTAGVLPLDYVVWTVISNIANINLSELPDEDQQRVQIDAYSGDQANARGLAERVRDAVEPFADVIRGPEPMYEVDTKLYRWSMDASFFTNRN